jgi:phage terminase large subunit-like protein
MSRQAYRWNYEDFVDFYLRLTLADGGKTGLEGFHRLILRELFRGSQERVWRSGQGTPEELTEGLVLIPKGHAKTTLMAGLGVFHLLVVRNANCYVGAADKIQAGELYRFAAHFIESEPEIDARLKVLRGTLEIRSRSDQGFMRILASDDSKQGGKRQGFNPTLAFLDELHAHENDALYNDMRSGLFKRNGLLVTITTAGWDQQGALGQLRNGFLSTPDTATGLNATDEGEAKSHLHGRLTVSRKPSGKSVMLEWAAADHDDLDDMEIVKLANPASWVTVQSLEDAKESLTPWNFMRYRANRWTLAFESWLPFDAWDKLHEPGLELDPSLPLCAAIDMARYRDCAALVAVQPRHDMPAAVKAWIWRPGGKDDPVPYETVKAAIRELHQNFTLSGCAFDPKYFDQAAEELAAEGIAMELFPQSLERMAPAAGELRQAILEGGLAHDGDPVLARHLMAAVAKDVGQGFKLDKSSRSGPDIDAAEALSMALSIAGTTPAEPLGAWA